MIRGLFGLASVEGAGRPPSRREPTTLSETRCSRYCARWQCRLGADGGDDASAASRFGDGQRRVVIKAHVARLGGRGIKAAALHLRYIQREGVEKDGTRGILYGPEGPTIPDAFEEPRRGEKHQFRIVVAPEDGGELDLNAYVRRLMKQVEVDLGREIEWAAVNHFDTGHPHAHVVIRGVDRNGRELRLDRGYISNGLRRRAQELATEELGPRLEVDLRRTRDKEVCQERLTSLDRELARRAQDNRVEMGSLRGSRIDSSTLIARLQYLEGLRVADRAGPGSWTLAAGWQDQVRDLGTRGDILKQMHLAVHGDRSRYHVVRVGEAITPEREGSSLVGRVAAKGLSDELKGSYFAVLETPSGRAYHVPIDGRAAEELRVGDLVSFTTRPEPAARPVDREIAETARSSDGRYAPPAGADGREHPHVRRLRDLQRMGLAVREAGDGWKVVPNLLRALEDRARSGPSRHRLFVQKQPLSLQAQVRHRGEAWLDRLEPTSLAPHGFGAEVARAQEQRASALRGLRIDARDAGRSIDLQEAERLAVGRRIASQSGLVFVADIPASFRGRVGIEGSADPSAPYVSISDGSRFVLVRATPILRSMPGGAVELTRDARGQVQVRLSQDRDLGR